MYVWIQHHTKRCVSVLLHVIYVGLATAYIYSVCMVFLAQGSHQTTVHIYGAYMHIQFWPTLHMGGEEWKSPGAWKGPFLEKISPLALLCCSNPKSELVLAGDHSVRASLVGTLPGALLSGVREAARARKLLQQLHMDGEVKDMEVCVCVRALAVWATCNW